MLATLSLLESPSDLHGKSSRRILATVTTALLLVAVTGWACAKREAEASPPLPTRDPEISRASAGAFSGDVYLAQSGLRTAVSTMNQAAFDRLSAQLEEVWKTGQRERLETRKLRFVVLADGLANRARFPEARSTGSKGAEVGDSETGEGESSYLLVVASPTGVAQVNDANLAEVQQDAAAVLAAEEDLFLRCRSELARVVRRFLNPN